MSNLSILNGSHTTDAKNADNKAIAFQRYATFSRYHAGQSEVDESTAEYSVFRRFGRALKCNSSMRFGDGSLDTAKLCVMTSLQIEQMAAIIHHCDDDLPFVVACLLLCGCRHTFGIFQRENRFVCHDQAPNALKTWSRMLSTLPTPGIWMILGAFALPDFDHAV